MSSPNATVTYGFIIQHVSCAGQTVVSNFHTAETCVTSFLHYFFVNVY